MATDERRDPTVSELDPRQVFHLNELRYAVEDLAASVVVAEDAAARVIDYLRVLRHALPAPQVDKIEGALRRCDLTVPPVEVPAREYAGVLAVIDAIYLDGSN